MGCIQSKNENIGYNGNIFRVQNIDDNGAPLWTGHLQLSQTELVLYRKRKKPTHWPLECLRRYGYDTERNLFSFESGRRCYTGSGIYAFRSLDNRAEMLFDALKRYIENQASEEMPGNQEQQANHSNTVPNGSAHPISSLDRNSRVPPHNPCISINQSPSPNSPSNPSRSTDNLTSDGHYIFANENHLPSNTPSSPDILISSSSGPISPDLPSPGSANSSIELHNYNNMPKTQINCPEVKMPKEVNNNLNDGCSNIKNKDIFMDIPPQSKAPPVTIFDNAVDNRTYIIGDKISKVNDSSKVLVIETQPTSPINDTASHEYANISFDNSSLVKQPTPTAFAKSQVSVSSTYENWNSGPSTPTTTVPVQAAPPNTGINYAQIVINPLDNSSSTSLSNGTNNYVNNIIPINNVVPVENIPPSATNVVSQSSPPSQYAKIDFNKTEALYLLNESSSQANEASRTTRHDTKHNNPPYKHSNSISD